MFVTDDRSSVFQTAQHRAKFHATNPPPPFTPHKGSFVTAIKLKPKFSQSHLFILHSTGMLPLSPQNLAIFPKRLTIHNFRVLK